MTASDGRADLVLTGGKIRSPAHPSGFVQALAIRGGLIHAVGSPPGNADMVHPPPSTQSPGPSPAQ